MFNLAPIIAGVLGGLFVNGFFEKPKRQISSVRNNYAKNSETYRFTFSEKTVFEKMEKIAKRFKLEIKFESYGQNEYFFSFIGKYPFNIGITPYRISILTWYNDYYFMLFAKSMSDYKTHILVDDDDDTIGFSSDISFTDLSDDEIFDIVEKIIEALYGAKSMNYETIKADDGKESFIFYLDVPDYYGYTETTEIGNFKFILNKENGGN